MSFTQLLALAQQMERAKKALSYALRRKGARIPHQDFTYLAEILAQMKLGSLVSREKMAIRVIVPQQIPRPEQPYDFKGLLD